MLELDHLVVGAATLEQGVAYVRDALGVIMPFGGAHPLMGTHNHLMRLGDGAFLEIIAVDPAAAPARKRWFGLDDPATRARLAARPRLIGWVARTRDLAGALREVPGSRGEAIRVTRGELAWLIGVPADGSPPWDGAFPTLLEWPPGPLPASRMADLGCRLSRLDIAHPRATEIAANLADHLRDDRIAFTPAEGFAMRATIETPLGPRELV